MDYPLINPPGTPFHGEFSSSDPSGLSEANSRFTLYGTDKAALTVGATDQVVISDVTCASGNTNTISIYDGADTTIDAGERIGYVRQTTVGQSYTLSTPHYCKVGTYPKVKGLAVQTDVIIHGVIIRGS